VTDSRRLAGLLLSAVSVACAQPSAGPSGIQKINHVVFLIKENRTYDNMFGAFNATYGAKTCKLSTGQVVPMGRAADRYPHDIDHSWAAATLAMNNGKMTNSI
jgi:phospholipase C